MLQPHLRSLLERIRAGEATSDEVVAARGGLVAIMGEGDGDAAILDDAGDAAVLLEILEDADGACSGPLRTALCEEHPEADVASAVMAALFDAAPSVAGAVAHEAGRVPEVADTLDPDAVPVAAAVLEEAGPAPDVSLRFAEGDAPVAAAVAHEAGRPPELGAAFDPGALPLAEALADEAGPVDLASAVLARLTDPDGLPEAWLSALLDRELGDVHHVRAAERAAADPRLQGMLVAWADAGRALREELARGAGPAPAVWHEVATELGLGDPEEVAGWDASLLAEAVQHEAGTVDVVAGVLEKVRRDARAPVPDLPEPVNRGWFAAAVAVAAAAALVIVLPRWLGDSTRPGAVFEEQRRVDFASADEISIDRVRYGENASVYVEVPEDEDMPVVIWVDDGGSL